MYKLVLKLLIVATPIVLVSVACPQELTNAKANLNPTQNSAFGQGRLSPRIVPTEAYRRDVLRVMIQEANRMAKDLDLSEQLPITRSNLISSHIDTVSQFTIRSSFGTLTTSNYEYYLIAGRTAWSFGKNC